MKHYPVILCCSWVAFACGPDADVGAQSADLALVAEGPRAVPLEVKVKDAVLLAQIHQPGGFSLPQFFVFDRAGAQVLTQTGYTDDFIERLDDALSAPAGAAGESVLTLRVADLEQMDGAELAAASLHGHDFVFLEYWAQWCAPCQMQERAVHAFLAAHPAQHNIAWIRAEFDPKKIDLRAISPTAIAPTGTGPMGPESTPKIPAPGIGARDPLRRMGDGSVQRGSLDWMRQRSAEYYPAAFF